MCGLRLALAGVTEIHINTLVSDSAGTIAIQSTIMMLDNGMKMSHLTNSKNPENIPLPSMLDHLPENLRLEARLAIDLEVVLSSCTVDRLGIVSVKGIPSLIR